MDDLVLLFKVAREFRVLGFQFAVTVKKTVKIFHIIHSGLDDVLNMFCQAGNCKIGVIICDDFGFVFTGDFNGAKLPLDFWMVFDIVLNFDFVMDSKCCGEDEVRVFLMMVSDAGGEVVGVAEFDEFLVVGVCVVDGAEVNTLSIHWELAYKSFFDCAFLFLGQGDGGLVEGGDDFVLLFELRSGLFELGGGLFELCAEFAGFGIKDLMECFFHLHVILVDFASLIRLCFQA